MNKRSIRLILLGAIVSAPIALSAQTLEFRGVKANARYDDGSTYKSTYIGWDSEQGKAIFDVDQGLWKMDITADTVTAEVVKGDNLMYANSGAVYKNDTIVTVYSRESEDDPTKMEFKVRWWKASDGTKLREETFPQSANLESRGMSYNPVDGKVYGLFYFTGVALPDPVSELDSTDIQNGDTTDAGYALGTIDLNTMKIQQITPGLYYDNFVTLACSPEGRIFSMTASGTLVEFDRQKGIIITKTAKNSNGETVQVNKYDTSGVKSQFKRQASCFDFTTGKLYWNGFVNNGMGYNDFGSYGPLPDRSWKTNGKYDTALYEINIETGAVTRISGIQNRLSLACMWIPGRDASDVTGIEDITAPSNGNVKVYNQQGMLIYTGSEADMNLSKGLYIIKQGNSTKKVLKK